MSDRSEDSCAETNCVDSAEEQAVAQLRRDLRASLPSLMREALASYRRFSAGPPPDEPKAFLAYQAGCRAALAHVQLLTKLAEFVDAPVSDSSSHDTEYELEGLIRAARDALESQDTEVP